MIRHITGITCIMFDISVSQCDKKFRASKCPHHFMISLAEGRNKLTKAERSGVLNAKHNLPIEHEICPFVLVLTKLEMLMAVLYIWPTQGSQLGGYRYVRPTARSETYFPNMLWPTHAFYCLSIIYNI